MEERLQKVIANSGIASRRKAEELILNGEVIVNGEIVTTLGTKVLPTDEIIIGGKKLQKEKKEYYLLNKPRGVVCTTDDELDRENIVDLIGTNARIYPVGRLDYDTTGLIILTNDGEMANFLMHPRNKIEKTYIAKLEGILSMEEYHKVKKGVRVEGTKVVPSRLKMKSRDLKTNTCIVEISISVGMNHVIKKIFEAVGHCVIKLKRTDYATFSLNKLQSGEYRSLTNKEVNEIYNMMNCNKK